MIGAFGGYVEEVKDHVLEGVCAGIGTLLRIIWGGSWWADKWKGYALLLIQADLGIVVRRGI